MKFAEFDDPRWDDLIAQMSIEECMGVIASCGNSFRTIESVGFLEASLTENSGNGVDLQLFQTNTPEAPWTIATENDKSDPNADYEMEVFGPSARTWRDGRLAGAYGRHAHTLGPRT